LSVTSWPRGEDSKYSISLMTITEEAIAISPDYSILDWRATSAIWEIISYRSKPACIQMYTEPEFRSTEMTDFCKVRR